MAIRIGRALALGLAVFAAALPLPGVTQSSAPFDMSAGNLLVVLRESRGENKQDEALLPFGVVKVRLADGRDVEFTASWFRFLGDMHVRVVFDGDRNMQ